MKLKLQFTASVSNPPPDARPLSRKNSPSSPAVRDILDRHQASLSLGRSQSFSHQQPSKFHLTRYIHTQTDFFPHVVNIILQERQTCLCSRLFVSSRTGSVMERRAITPPVGSPVGRPLYLPPDRNILSLDKIAKRECKVLVLDSHT